MLTIETFQFGQVTIDHQKYRSDFVLCGDTIHEGWRRKRGHFLQLVDLELYQSQEIKIWIIGTGKFGVLKIAPEVGEYCAENGIQLIAEKTPRAIQAYQQIRTQSDNVLAAFHINC